MEQWLYRRVMLKLSGESLSGEEGAFDSKAVRHITEIVGTFHRAGIQLGIVVGGGNILRGSTAHLFHRVQADMMGMLATLMNALALEDLLNQAKIPAQAFSSIELHRMMPLNQKNEIQKALNEGKVIIFGGGTGNPFFTTDTTAALRALEMDAEVLIKGTKVNGIYNKDPQTDPNAVRFERLTYQDCLNWNLGIMDAAAFSLCQTYHLPIVVCSFRSPENFLRILKGDFSVGTLVTD